MLNKKITIMKTKIFYKTTAAHLSFRSRNRLCVLKFL